MVYHETTRELVVSFMNQITIDQVWAIQYRTWDTFLQSTRINKQAPTTLHVIALTSATIYYDAQWYEQIYNAKIFIVSALAPHDISYY